MSYQVEAGVQIPKRSVVGRRRGSKYPFADMEIGHSFYADGVKESALRSAASVFVKSNGGYRFAVRAEGDGARVWRIEPKQDGEA